MKIANHVNRRKMRTCPLCGLDFRKEGQDNFILHVEDDHEFDNKVLARYLLKEIERRLNRKA